ncbi:MAG: site-specific integrase [Bacteroidia bacterium]|nr:site-specific integrase [Bacteroidia bacterium]
MATITKRNDGYHIMVSCGYDINNRQIRKCTTWNPDPGMTQKMIEKAVNEAAVLFEDQVRKGQVLEGTIKFAEFAEKWLKDYGEKQLAPKTLVRYRSFLDRTNQAIGHIRLDKLQPQHLMEFYSNLSEEGLRSKRYWTARPSLIEKLEKLKKRSIFMKEIGMSTATLDTIIKGGSITFPTAEKVAKVMNMTINRAFNEYEYKQKLSNRTVLHYHRLISSILQTAMYWQIIPSNIAKRVKAPKVKRSEANYLDEHEVKEVLLKLEHEPIKYRTMVKLFLYSGMRRGELAGLEWGDINWDKSMITIQRSSQYIPKQGIITKETKTTTSDRTIRLPVVVFDMLRKFREWQDEQKNRLGDQWFISDRLFTTFDGHPIHPDSITGWFTDFIKRNNLPKVNIHSLRHTNITLLIMAGVPLRTVARRAGHASTATTSVIYSHAIQSADEMASEVMEGLLG